MPNIDTEYGQWMAWAMHKISETDVGDAMDALFESYDAFWMDLQPPDRETLLGARKAREAALEP